MPAGESKSTANTERYIVSPIGPDACKVTGTATAGQFPEHREFRRVRWAALVCGIPSGTKWTLMARNIYARIEAEG